jgi:uncharacterized membrane protein (DUF485 family)
MTIKSLAGSSGSHHWPHAGGATPTEESEMTQPQGTAGDGAGASGSEHHPEIDWEAAERSPEFQELVKKRRSFVVPATIFFLAWYFGFIILAGYAEDFMGREFIADGITVGYALALSQFLMVWGLGWLYLRRADRVFDPLAKRAAKRALEAAGGAPAGPGPRFQREAGPAAPTAEGGPAR